MSFHRSLMVAAAAGMLLGGCTFSTADWFRDSPPPEPVPAPSAGPAPTAPAGAAAAPAGTYPYGTAGAPAEPVLPVPEEEPVIVRAPDGSTWNASGRSSRAAQAAIDSCYAMATARTQRDQRITDDINAGANNLADNSQFSPLIRSVDDFDLQRRQGSLFSECMRNKGFIRG